MKLHLPKGLRAALLAVLTSAAAALSSTASAADFDFNFSVDYKPTSYSISSTGTNYDLTTNTYEAWSVTNDDKEETYLNNNQPSKPLYLTSMPDANLQDWVMVIDGYNLTPVINDNEPLGISLICNTGDNTDLETGEVTLNNPNALSLMIDSKGRLRLATTMDDTDRLRNNVILGDVGSNWYQDDDASPVSLRVILSWDADGGQPRGYEDGLYGSLTFVGAYLLSNDDGSLLEQMESDFTGTEIITNYELPENLLGFIQDNEKTGVLYSLAGDNSQVKVTLHTNAATSAKDWAPSAAWLVTAPTSINDLLAGNCYDKVQGTNATLGSHTFTNPLAPYEPSDTYTDKIKFSGTKGALILTEQIDGNAEYQLMTDRHEIGFTIDPTQKRPEVVAGFGALENLTLRVDIDVLENTILAQEACGLQILGNGTTVLEIDNTGVRRIGQGNEYTAIDINTEAGQSIDGYIADRKIDMKGKEKVQVNKNSGAEDKHQYWFIVERFNPNRLISFANTDTASNIVLSPKGNGNVVLSVITSNIAPECTITMRDESGWVDAGTVTPGANEHAYNEHVANSNYSSNTPFSNPISGTDMVIQLYSSAVESSNSYGGRFVQEIAGGNILIDGRNEIYGTNSIGSSVVIGGIMSTFTATSLESAASIEIESNLNITDSITVGTGMDSDTSYEGDQGIHKDESGGLFITAGDTRVKGDVTVYAGVIYVSYQGDITHATDPHAASLTVGGTLDYKSTVDNMHVYGSATINELRTVTPVYVGTGYHKEDFTPNAKLIVYKADTPEIEAPGVNIRRKGGTSGLLVDGRTVIGTRGISSQQIEADTEISLKTTDATLAANVMKGSDVFLGDSQVATVIDLRHEQINGAGQLQMSHTAAIATGKLSADEFHMPDAYTIMATELDIDTLVVTPPAQEAVTFALTRNAASSTVYEDVQMKNALITKNATYASEISAYSVTLDEGYTLKSNGTDPLRIKVDTAVTANDGVTLSNICLVDGDLTTKNNVVIDSLQIEGGKFKTLGTATITNMSLEKVTQFGGANGDAFKPVAANDGKANMVFNGNIGEDGNSLKLTSIVFDASGHDFGAGDSIPVIEASAGSSISVDPNANVSFKVQPFTYAQVDKEALANGQLKLQGEKDEARAKSELVGSKDFRAENMKALEEAMALDKGGELHKLFDDMGMVMEAPLSQRQQILDSISGASLTALADSQRRGVQNVQNSLRNRIIQMGGNADWENAGIQAWAQADGAFSTTKSSDDAPGYDYTAWGATVGANIDLAETVTAGMSLSASYGEIESDHADKASGDNNAYYVNLFARHQTGRWTQMLILTAGQNDMTLERTVGSYTAEGDTSGSTFSAYYEVGYTLGLNNEFTHILQPIVSARITSAKVDGYDEKGSIGNAALSYDGGSYTYGTIAAGFRYQGVMYESVFERNSVLEVRAMVTSDFGDTTDTAKVALGQGKMREVKGVDTSGTGFDLGVGLSIPMEMQTTLFFDADVNIRPDYTGVSANVGLRYDF